MVKLKAVIGSNTHIAEQHHQGKVCVFAGATSGIGLATLRRLSTLLRSSTFYILGRNEAKFTIELASLRAAAPSSRLIFVEAQFALIRSVDLACERIIAAEQKVDYVCLSAGGIPFQGATYTSEGLETCFAVSYYSRLRLISNLLPLLRRAPQPRILSILNGTKETKIDTTDIGLQRKWGVVAIISHSTICTSLAFDHLASTDSTHKLTLIHATPGLVNTGTPPTPVSKNQGYVWWALMSFLQMLLSLMVPFLGVSLEESGERHAFLLTREKLVPGSYCTDQYNEIVPDNTTLKFYKEIGWTPKFWDHTLDVWEKASAA